MKKKITKLLLAIISVLSLSGCGAVASFLGASAQLLETAERTIVESGNNIREVKETVKAIDGTCREINENTKPDD